MVAVVDGYVEAVPGLVGDGERRLLPLAGPLMAFEAAPALPHRPPGRATSTSASTGPGHNLTRARNQLRLVERLVEVRPRLAEVVA